MNPTEAEKLLGGYATGTLTEAEEKLLFAAALEREDIFAALMQEEALRDLLTDPASKAQLLAALAPAPPKLVPFWRRPGLLGAAASLLVASLAGLAYLRSPEATPPLKLQQAAKAVAPQITSQAPAVQVQEAPTHQKKGPTPSAAVPASPSAPMIAIPPPPAADQAMVEAVATQAVDSSKEDAAKVQAVAPLKARRQDQDRLARIPTGAPGGAAGSMVGGLVGDAAPRPAPALAAEAKAEAQVAASTTQVRTAPRWTLESMADGSTRVSVLAPRTARLFLLKRGSAGIEVVRLQFQEKSRGDLVPWRAEIRLGAGEVLDLYQLNHSVSDPTTLPERGPIDGFRARIHPNAK